MVINMKLVIVPKNLDDINKFSNNGIDTFIVGLKDYSINYPSFDIDTIKDLSTKYKLFVSINKNLFNSELNTLKNLLVELSNLNILGVMFYDIGLLNIVKENNIKIDLVWHQTNMVTNYNTCNFYYDNGCKYGYLANEITLDEMLEIKEKTKMDLFVLVCGYPIMSHSRRSLLTNYFKSLNKEKENKTYTITNSDIKCLIKENKDGTSILLGSPVNGSKPLFELVKNNFNYGVIDTQELDTDICLKVVDKFNYIINNIDSINDSEKEEIINYINSLIGDNTNFFYKRTIYKVK